MSSSEATNSPSDFLVCQSEECHQSISICHRSYFKGIHHDFIQGKKSSHKSMQFTNSLQYLNFKSIYRLNYILSKKISEAIKPLQSNVQPVVQSALYTSPIFRDLFSQSDQAISQYFYLCQIHQGNTMGALEYFSSDFCNALLTLNEKIINKLYKELCGYTPQWQNLNLEFNYASGINSSYLEAFIAQQIQYLTQYINKVGDKFDIKEYITQRNSSKQTTNDPYYYTHEFTTFLIQKYEKNAAEQTMLDLIEYYLNFWKYFFVVLDTNKNAVKYFQEQISFYKEYEKQSEQQKLAQSFLAYRMWRINRKTSTYLPSLRNPYFFQTFIYSFIQYLIQKKLFTPELQRNYDFKVFSSYLQDYVKYVKEKGEQFTFNRYGEYFQFRSITEKLEQNLKKNKDIVYDRKFFVEYVHNEFAEGNKLGIKKYKKYQQKRAAQEDEKARIFREQTEKLRADLVQAQKEHFYQVVYNNFITQVAAPKSALKLNRQSYELFKGALLSKFDQSYIQTIEAEYIHSLSQQNDRLEQTNEEKLTDKKVKVKQEINADEEELAQLINQEQKSEADSSEEENILVQNCACCKGKPYQCEQPDCRILGCCSACMLDY